MYWYRYLKLQNNLPTKKKSWFNVCNILNRHPKEYKTSSLFLYLRRKEAQELEQIVFFFISFLFIYLYSWYILHTSKKSEIGIILLGKGSE